MEKVPTTLKAWMDKAINFHKQKARIIAFKKGHSTNECRSSQTPGKPKENYCPQQVRNTKTSELLAFTTTTIAPVTPIDAFIQNLTTKGKTPEDILQTLKICYEEDGEDVATATTFPDNEDF